MADVEEPQFTSLQARIAALNQTQAARPYNGVSTAGKRPPPPPPPTSKTQSERPQPDFRSKSINNPPVSSFNGGKQYNNEPASQKTLTILPPPPVDRDTIQVFPQMMATKAKPPALPRRESLQPPQSSITPRVSPSLPPRRPGGQNQLSKRTSNESIMSQSSSISTFSIGTGGASSTTSMESNVARKLPPCLEQTTLPALPPTKRELAAKAQLEKDERKASDEARRALHTVKSSPAVSQASLRKSSHGQSPAAIMPAPSQTPGLPPRHNSVPSLPPRLPSRGPVPQPTIQDNGPALATRRLPPTTIPPMTARPRAEAALSRTNETFDEPPPVPRASRPTASQIEASRSAVTARPSNGIYAPRDERTDCMLCRDFSAPDSVAAQYPRHTLPRNPTNYLAQVLCSSFDSPTDKARAIFVWLHHNVDYDTEAFFGNNVQHATPESTIQSGLAVCAGYAGVFSAVALAAGLECIMVTGHGKGYGFADRTPDDPIPPPDPSGHAWNAVRIDNGEWKLLDSCWGAGQLSDMVYKRNLAEECFTMSNEDFGLKHFPSDPSHFFRADGRSLTWGEYILGPLGVEGPHTCSTSLGTYGISETSFMPISRTISVRQPGLTHCQFSKKCLHWDFLRNDKSPGKPYCMILQYNGIDGREKDYMPFDFDGTYWYLDIETRKLGCRPMKVMVWAVTSVDGKDARGWSKGQYLAAKGRKAMGFQTVATWELV